MTVIGIAIVGRAITIYRKSILGKRQRNYSKNEAKKIKSGKITRSNIEKYNIAIAILKKLIIR